MVVEDGELKAYGAGILSSYGEIDEFRDMELRPLDITEMGTADYDITHYQPVLYRAESLDEVRDVVGGFLATCTDESISELRASAGATQRLSDTLVFIPAWNEDASLPAVLAEARRELPGADLLVIDDGSTDGTADAAKQGGALVVGFPENRGLRAGIAEGYRQALERGYDFCGRLDADGQHPAGELARMLAMVRAGDCDVAVGSRFLADPDREGERYRPAPERVVGTSLLRLLLRLRLGQPISDGTSGMYAVNREALELLADPYVCEAPEVEALMRITDAKLRLVEVPVHMRQREHGESSFRGRRAVELVVTIGLTLFAGELLRRRHRAKQRSGLGRLLRRG